MSFPPFPTHPDPDSDLIPRPIADADGSLFDHLIAPAHTRVRQTWAVGGGKGGVGKSLIASSLAVALARAAGKTTALDLDLGGSNLHTSLGVDLPRHTLSDFIAERVGSLREIVTASGIPQLDLISGAQDSVNVTQLDPQAKIRILQGVCELNTDYVLFDLGAGTSQSTIDFFLYADIGLVVLLPEPTSIENAYRFIKTSYYRYLWHSKRLRGIRHLIESAMDSKSPGAIRSPSDLFREANAFSQEMGVALKQEIDRFRIKLIVNQARTQADVDIGHSVKSVCKKYFGIDVDYLGFLEYESAVWQAVRRKKPLLLEFPHSRLVMSLDRITQTLLRQHAQSKSGLR